MATQRRRLNLKAAMFRTFADGAARFSGPGSGSTTPYPVDGWTFADAVVRELFLRFRLPPDYDSDLRLAGTLIFASATANEARMGGAIAAISPSVDAVSILADDLAAETTVDVTALSPAGRPINFEIDLATLDSAAAGDLVTARIRRLGDDGADDATGAVHLIDLEYTYDDGA